jgi:predicted ATPase
MESNFLECAPDSPQQKIAAEDFSLFNNHFQYLGAERIGPRPHFPIDNYQVEKSGSIGFQGEYSIHFLAKYQREEVTLHSLIIAETRDLLSNIEAWMGRISPGIRLQARLYPDLNLAKLSFRFETESETTQEFNPVNVGFGYTYVLPVFIAVLAAKKGDLVIIENPESHIHPRGQAQLGEFFALAAKDGVQLLIETHSDHLINGVRVALKKKKISPDDVLLAYMERDLHAPIHESYITIPGIDKDGRIDKYPEGFMDEYAKQLDELIK